MGLVFSQMKLSKRRVAGKRAENAYIRRTAIMEPTLDIFIFVALL